MNIEDFSIIWNIDLNTISKDLNPKIVSIDFSENSEEVLIGLSEKSSYLFSLKDGFLLMNYKHSG